MKEKTSGRGKIKTDSIIFIVSILVAAFWWVSKFIDVYQFKLVGIVYEILWLPSIAALFILPVISVVFWMKIKFKLQSYYPFSILIAVITILTMILN